jgi:hypothetical protein
MKCVNFFQDALSCGWEFSKRDASVSPAKGREKQARVRVAFPFAANGVLILLESEKVATPLRTLRSPRRAIGHESLHVDASFADTLDNDDQD